MRILSTETAETYITTDGHGSDVVPPAKSKDHSIKLNTIGTIAFVTVMFALHAIVYGGFIS